MAFCGVIYVYLLLTPEFAYLIVVLYELGMDVEWAVDTLSRLGLYCNDRFNEIE